MTDSKQRETRLVEARRRVTVRDYLVFVLKVFLDGMKDGLLITVATGAVALDLLSGGGKRPRLFYSVLRFSERFDLWLNLNGAVEKMDAGLDDDGLFGASDAGADTLLGKVEQMVRGGDEPRGQRRATSSGEPEPEEAPGDEPEPPGPASTRERPPAVGPDRSVAESDPEGTDASPQGPGPGGTDPDVPEPDVPEPEPGGTDPPVSRSRP